MRGFSEDQASQFADRLAAMEDLEALFREKAFAMGSKGWTRADLHERAHQFPDSRRA
jgi:hypothetical protein